MSEPHQLEELLSVRSLAELLVHLTFWTSRRQLFPNPLAALGSRLNTDMIVYG